MMMKNIQNNCYPKTFFLIFAVLLQSWKYNKKPDTVFTLIPSFYNPSLLPGDQAAVMDNAVLHIHSSLFLCVYRPVVMAPAQSDGGVQVGGGALQWESVTPEH